MLSRFRKYEDDGSERYKIVKKVIAYEESSLNALLVSPKRALSRAIVVENEVEEKSDNDASDKFEKIMNLTNVISNGITLPSVSLDDEYEIAFINKIREKYYHLSDEQKQYLINCKIQSITKVLDEFYRIVFIDDELHKYLKGCLEDFSFHYNENKETLEEYLEAAYIMRYNLLFRTLFQNILDKEPFYFRISKDDLKNLIILSLMDYKIILEEILEDDDSMRDPFFDSLEELGAVGYYGNGKYYPKESLPDLCLKIVKKNNRFSSSFLFKILVKGPNDSSPFNKQSVQRKLGDARIQVEEEN